MMQQNFEAGSKVVVKVRDWGPNNPVKVYTLSGIVLSRVYAPAGYNVHLDKPHTFVGNLPLPFTDQCRIDLGTQAQTLTVIFVRPFDILHEPERDMRFVDEVVKFCSSLHFSKVTAVLPLKDKLKVSHVLYYFPTGEVKTVSDVAAFAKGREGFDSDRLVTKYAHFYGFASRTQKSKDDDSLYFSSNRYAHIYFTKSLSWGEIRPNPPKPETGDVLCCSISGKFNGSSESMDAWFIASQEFQLFVNLCCSRVKMSLNDAVEQLIIPDNKKKMPILTEVPECRYLYAGMWLLMNKQHIPDHYNLPERRGTGAHVAEMEPFSTWWPRAVMAKRTE